MPKNLVIVESPAKGKTIAKYLGKDFSVSASMGHIRDLPTKKTDLPEAQQKLPYATLGIDVDHDFAPLYIVTPSKKSTVSQLKSLVKKADKVWLATDEDREGEAIAWHLCKVLDLDSKKTPRIVFHEITKEAILGAIKKPRTIDFDRVDAQQARRILDRLVGYELSPLLWKKIRYGLSAGRVQSVAVRLIVDRERERQNFQIENYGEIIADLRTKNKDLLQMSLEKIDGKKINDIQERIEGEKKRLIKNRLEPKMAEEIVKKLKDAIFKVTQIEHKERRSEPSPPYTTATLQRDASTRLGFPVQKTMRAAQKLYETGYITYMRTDSVTLSQSAISQACKVVKEIFGTNFLNSKTRQFANKSKSAQEAHEAIRPTDFSKQPGSVKSAHDEALLYDLIWRRAIATQMKPAILAQTNIEALTKIVENNKSGKNNSSSLLFSAHGVSVKFAGFTEAYPVGTKETILPKVVEKEILDADKIHSETKETSSPPRYTEAALVKKMEQEGIGRPSTYAPTIATIINRGYIERDENKALFPTDTAFVVTDLLVEHFQNIVDLKFTARMEEDLDEIATGEKKWVPVIREFYKPFHSLVKEKTSTIDKSVVTNLGDTDEKCPECNKPLQIKLGKFGKFLSCTGFPKCKFGKPLDGKDHAEQEISDEKCAKCGLPMLIKSGRFGSFLACSGYPKCKNTKPITKGTGIKCLKCKKGEIVEKRSRFGKIFYACDNYPDCKAAYWQKPTGKICDTCGDLLVMQKRGAVCGNVECASRKGKAGKSKKQRAGAKI
ncbi:MAG: type I DNA topoisomerase [Patescibacteria group bacterium]|nr:type I DNA topoisomerase [Patescibacteria group bacterium]